MLKADFLMTGFIRLIGSSRGDRSADAPADPTRCTGNLLGKLCYGSLCSYRLYLSSVKHAVN